MTMEPGEGVTGKVWESGQAMVVDDYVAWDERAQGWVDSIGHGAVVAAPIRWQDEILGVIVLDHDTPGMFDQDDAEILELLGSQAAVAIQNARLFQAEDRRRREAETLREVGLIISSTTDQSQVLNLILEQLKRVITYDSAAVEIVDGDRLVIRAAAGIDHPEEVLGKTFLIEEDEFVHPILYGGEVVVRDDITAHDGWEYVDGTEDTHSWIGVPLQVQDRVIGLITVDHHEVGFYSQEDALVVSSFARHVAIALENARLFEQAARRMDRLESLRSIDLAINSSLDVKISLNILLDAVMEQLKVDAAAVMLYNNNLQSLKFFLGIGLVDKHVEQTTLRLGQGLAGHVALKRKKLYVPDLSQREEQVARKRLFEAERFRAYYGIPLIAKGELIGVLELFHREKIKPGSEWLSFLETLARQAAIAIDNASLFQELQRSNLDLSRAYDATLESWAQVLEQIQFEIEGHTDRALKLTMRLASRLGIRGNEMTHVRRGALLHDVGKLGVPAEILRKPGPLTEEEWQVAKQHPVYAYRWLSSIQVLRPALDIPYCHHERWDGTGYPRQLGEGLIPLPARIFAVVDSWDMLTHDCAYRDAWSREKALEYIREQAGKRFDPRVVDAFLEQIEDMEGE
jgi:HD-GYP domain-containing protein (c-di-GMP phosphodiesterase class II)